MGVRKGPIAALLPVALVLFSGGAWALEAGDDGTVSAHIDLERIPDCKVKLHDEVCVLGYDNGGSSTDLGDDTIFLYQSTKKVVVTANTETLRPTGLHELLPRRVSIDSRTTATEQPIFRKIGDVAMDFNETRPEPIRPFTEARHDEKRTVFIIRIAPVTDDTPLPKSAGVPLLHNYWNVTNYTHVRPLGNDLIAPTNTDYQADDWFDGTYLQSICTAPFGIPIEKTLPGICGALGFIRDIFGEALQKNLPNVVCCAGTSGGEIVFPPSNGHPGSTALGSDNDGLFLGDTSTTQPVTLHDHDRASSDVHAPFSMAPTKPLQRANSWSGQDHQLIGASPAQPASDLAPLLAATGAAIVVLALFLYSRLSRERLLENANRKAIYDAVLASPGITTNELATILALNYKSVERHVTRLLTAGLIVHRQDGRRKRLFENHGVYSARTKSLMAVLRTETARAVAMQLLNRTPATQSKISDRLGVSIATVSFHVNRLAGIGALIKQKRGRERILTVPLSWRVVLADYLERQGYDVSAGLGNSS